MRCFRRPALTSAIALPMALFICFNVYALRTTKTSTSPSHFRSQTGRYNSSSTMHTPTASKAPQLSPAELMARPLQTLGPHMPKLFHQSWSTTALPAKFEQWSLSCREMNPDFEWVLWTDEDNRRLVEKYAPDFLLKYNELKSEIYRADAVRSLYMFVFGGWVWYTFPTGGVEQWDEQLTHWAEGSMLIWIPNVCALMRHYSPSITFP